MKKAVFAIIAVLILMLPCNLSAKDLNYLIQGNLGYTIPAFTMANSLKPALGFGGAFAVENLFVNDLAFELSAKYSLHEGKNSSSTQMTIIPVILSALYSFPMDQFNIYAKLGGGIVYETLKMNSVESTNSDPGFLIGTAIGYPVGSGLELKLDINYLFIYQTYVTNASENGHNLSADLCVAFRF